MSLNDTYVKIILALFIPVLILAAAWGAIRETVREDIPALKAADKEQCEAIDANENAIITIEGRLDTIQSHQKAYHEDSDKKLDAIFEGVEALQRKDENP